EPAAQQQEAAFEVVLPRRQVQGLVEAQFAVGELRPPGIARRAEQFPQNLRRQPANEVLAVDEEALVRLVVEDLVPPGQRRGLTRTRRRPGRGGTRGSLDGRGSIDGSVGL